MGNDSVPNIVSFVIRFIREPVDEASSIPRYRGAIRHVQTDQESSFTCWAEAVDFIQCYVPLEQIVAAGDATAIVRPKTKLDKN